MNRTASNLAKRMALAVLWLYRKGLSGLKPPCCRFVPTCSEYATQAIDRFGALRGTLLAVRRLLRCQPLYRGVVYDPVPSRASWRPENPPKGR
ncbi:MAG: membrane protein insertion efficiency factor YidD [Lentisphaerae bacterium]|jgi:uncharacterized protein|nr:membrane protein insertion efficiency factor YidD [Lentisphaerota bacterium]MBT4818392.1 membrane protein insertion efficiency factor YidD [Lentisphaerota bacterium]MBT5611593.1 membrane protein insertion efficiency factor YidD [Lentisphaerota bacterium]MBT7061692.1 membrane protein insertion efficiency factor YidD [Lentisphaerota bacterium]MBT7846538.1 membrane protein insertion efficiency factor YidD [Lentisphaerota bacterium]